MNFNITILQFIGVFICFQMFNFKRTRRNCVRSFVVEANVVNVKVLFGQWKKRMKKQLKDTINGKGICFHPF